MTEITTLDNYTGSKKVNGLFQKIINQVSNHTIYAELFAGSGAICSLFLVYCTGQSRYSERY